MLTEGLLLRCKGFFVQSLSQPFRVYWPSGGLLEFNCWVKERFWQGRVTPLNSLWYTLQWRCLLLSGYFERAVQVVGCVCCSWRAIVRSSWHGGCPTWKTQERLDVLIDVVCVRLCPSVCPPFCFSQGRPPRLRSSSIWLTEAPSLLHTTYIRPNSFLGSMMLVFVVSRHSARQKVTRGQSNG